MQGRGMLLPSGQNDPAGHDAQYVDAGESEYVPLGHTVGSS